jgi:hypothetical protein
MTAKEAGASSAEGSTTLTGRLFGRHSQTSRSSLVARTDAELRREGPSPRIMASSPVTFAWTAGVRAAGRGGSTSSSWPSRVVSTKREVCGAVVATFLDGVPSMRSIRSLDSSRTSRLVSTANDLAEPLVQPFAFIGVEALEEDRHVPAWDLIRAPLEHCAVVTVLPGLEVASTAGRLLPACSGRARASTSRSLTSTPSPTHRCIPRCLCNDIGDVPDAV